MRPRQSLCDSWLRGLYSMFFLSWGTSFFGIFSGFCKTKALNIKDNNNPVSNNSQKCINVHTCMYLHTHTHTQSTYTHTNTHSHVCVCILGHRQAHVSGGSSVAKWCKDWTWDQEVMGSNPGSGSDQKKVKFATKLVFNSDLCCCRCCWKFRMQDIFP